MIIIIIIEDMQESFEEEWIKLPDIHMHDLPPIYLNRTVWNIFLDQTSNFLNHLKSVA